MGNRDKNKRLSITLEGDVLGAAKGNAGFFIECGGFGGEILRSPHSREAKKVSLTAGQVESILKIIEEISEGIKYPTKSGREYEGVVSFRDLLRRERNRQWNK